VESGTRRSTRWDESNREGRAVRRVACLTVLLTCLGLTSCSLFGKKSSSPGAANTPRGGGGGGGGGGPSLASAAPEARGEQTVTPAAASGLLAGQIVDAYDHRPTAPATIRVVADSSASAAPLEIPADNQGCFRIPGLLPGINYQLTATVKDGSRLLSGTVSAVPPNPRVVIRVIDDLTAVGSTPAAPGQGSVELGTPRATNPAPAVSPTPPLRVSRPEDIAGGPEASRNSPLIDIGPRTPRTSPDPPVPPPSAAPTPPSQGPTQVPSCFFSGQKLDNFALNDLDGGTWEFRQHRGRLVLLDFWFTMCPPCREAIPHLRILQKEYGAAGLEVVGIACETGLLRDKARKVSNLRDRMQINYRLLLTEYRSCPVQTQFGVERYPTLVLLDENGYILWRSEGLDRSQLRSLEIEIQRRLGVR
jgi:thiol-disulfide isomerase/thioredoxin